MAAVRFIAVKWQEGYVPTAGVNGVQVEEFIEVAIDRLKELREKLPDRETSLAITKLEEAQMWLHMRTSKRRIQGVEGTGQAHLS